MSSGFSGLLWLSVEAKLRHSAESYGCEIPLKAQSRSANSHCSLSHCLTIISLDGIYV